MTRDNTEQKPKPVSKKYEARQQKENRQKKTMIIVLAVIVAVVVLLVGYGILQGTVLKNNKAVAKVNNKTITVKQFVKRTQYERLSNVQTFTTYAASGYAMFFQSQLVEMQNALDNYVQFGSDVLDRMIREAVIAEKAAEMGITVSDEDINAEIESGFGFFPAGTPTPAPTFVFQPTSTMSSQQLALVTITPTPSPEPTATTDPSAPTATSIPATSTPAAEATATQIIPTPTEMTSEGFNEQFNLMISGINDQFPFTEADFRAYVKSLLINEKVFEAVTKDITREQEMVWARHILVGTEDEAKAIIERVNDGEDFGAVAKELSLDTSTSVNGGDLSWFSKGQMVEPFENAAFALKIGEISQPVQSDYGYHVIQLLGKEVRELTDSQWDSMKQKVFAEFIEEAKTGMDIKKLDVWASVAPSTPSIPSQYRITAQ